MLAPWHIPRLAARPRHMFTTDSGSQDLPADMLSAFMSTSAARRRFHTLLWSVLGIGMIAIAVPVFPDVARDVRLRGFLVPDAEGSWTLVHFNSSRANAPSWAVHSTLDVWRFPTVRPILYRFNRTVSLSPIGEPPRPPPVADVCSILDTAAIHTQPVPLPRHLQYLITQPTSFGRFTVTDRSAMLIWLVAAPLAIGAVTLASALRHRLMSRSAHLATAVAPLAWRRFRRLGYITASLGAFILFMFAFPHVGSSTSTSHRASVYRDAQQQWTARLRPDPHATSWASWLVEATTNTSSFPVFVFPMFNQYPWFYRVDRTLVATPIRGMAEPLSEPELVSLVRGIPPSYTDMSPFDPNVPRLIARFPEGTREPGSYVLVDWHALLTGLGRIGALLWIAITGLSLVARCSLLSHVARAGRKGQCPSCAYPRPLSAVAKCPECGAPPQ